MGETYTRRVELKSTVERIDEELAFLQRPPQLIQARVRGEGLELMQLYYNPPQIVIDASENRINFFEAVSRQLPRGVTLEQVYPYDYVLQTEARIRKRLPVIPRTSLSLPPTYELVHPPSVFPDSVEVTGAKSIVESLTAWPTVFFEKEGVKDTLSVMLALSDSLSGLLDLELQEVRLTAIAEEFTEGSREINVMVTEVSSNQNTVALDPPVIEVLFRVPLSQYRQAMEARDFFASVSYGTLRDDTTGFVSPSLVLPQGILMLNVSTNPDAVRYFDLLNDE